MARLIDGDALIAWIKGSQQMTSKMKAVIAKIKTMPSADRPQEWIPCSERLPSEFVDVLVCLTDGTMDVVQLTDYVDIDGEPKWCHSTDYTLGGAILNKDVVAWMPLPKPYGERKESER